MNNLVLYDQICSIVLNCKIVGFDCAIFIIEKYMKTPCIDSTAYYFHTYNSLLYTEFQCCELRSRNEKYLNFWTVVWMLTGNNHFHLRCTLNRCINDDLYLRISVVIFLSKSLEFDSTNHHLLHLKSVYWFIMQNVFSNNNTHWKKHWNFNSTYIVSVQLPKLCTNK